jgi:hypothetical protein
LQSAYPDEILSKSDVVANRTYNSYASRHYDASRQLIDDTVELHKQYIATHPSSLTNLPADSTAPAANASIAPVAPTDSPTSEGTSPTASTDATAPATDSPAVLRKNLGSS